MGEHSIIGAPPAIGVEPRLRLSLARRTRPPLPSPLGCSQDICVEKGEACPNVDPSLGYLLCRVGLPYEFARLLTVGTKHRRRWVRRLWNASYLKSEDC